MIRKPGTFYFRQRLIALFVCAALLFSQQFSYANDLPGVERNPQGPFLEKQPGIIIPEKFGKTEEAFTGSTGKTIIYIQDAHDSLEAQENIAKIINHFVEQYGVQTVYEEGYEGRVPTDKYFGFIKNPLIKEKVSYFLMDKLRLGGAEYAHINRQKDFNLIGADSLKLHFANVNQYRKAARQKEETEQDLKVLETEIRKLANQCFPKDLKEWMKLRERLDKNELSLLDYLRRVKNLLEYSISSQDYQKRYPHISLLLSSENSVDKQVMEKVKAIESKTLFQEINLLENDYANRYLSNEQDRKVFEYYKDLEVLSRLNSIELSSSEFEAVKSTLHKLNTERLVKFIAQATHKPTLLSKRWEFNIREAIKFYELAYQRNKVIENKLSDFLSNTKETIALLVFGGFHSEEIKQSLKKNQISYQIVTPKIQQTDERHKAYYKQLMSVGKYSFEAPINVRIGSRPESSIIRWQRLGLPFAIREVQVMARVARDTQSQDITIFGREVEKRLTILRQKSLEQAVRSEVRENIEIQGPDGPIKWEIENSAANIIKALQWNIALEEGVKETQSNLASFNPDYDYFFDGDHHRHTFLWALQHAYDPAAQFTMEQRDSIAKEILRAFESFPTLEILELFQMNEDQLEAWWYWFIQALIQQHKLSQAPESELKEKNTQLIQDLYHIALDQFKEALKRGFTPKNLKAFFEPRLFQLATSQPSLRAPIGELLKNWDDWAEEGEEVILRLWRPQQEEEPVELTEEWLMDALQSATQSARRQQWVAEQLLKLRNILTPRSAEAIQMWDHPIAYMEENLAGVRTIFIDTTPETNVHYETSTGEMPNRWKFRLELLDQMGKDFKQWTIISSQQYIEAILKAFPRQEERSSIHQLESLLEEYLKSPTGLPIRDYLGIPPNGTEDPVVTASLNFWKGLWTITHRHKAEIALFRALEFEEEEGAEFKRFNEWMARTSASKRIIIGAFPDIHNSETQDTLGNYSDPSVIRINHNIGREDYEYPEIWNSSASLGYVAQQIGQARGWGNNQSASFPVRGNEELSHFFTHENGREDAMKARTLAWWGAVTRYPKEYGNRFNTMVVTSESEGEKEEEPWIPEDIDAGVKGPKELVPAGRSELRLSNLRQVMSLIENKRVLIDFNDLVENFSDEQIKEVAFIARSEMRNVQVLLYNVDLSHPLGNFFRGLKLPDLKIESDLGGAATNKALANFNGEVVHLSSASYHLEMVTLRRILGERRISRDRQYLLAYRDQRSGTLGIGLRDIQRGDLKQRVDAGELKQQLPDYMDSFQSQIFVANPALAGLSSWQTLYNSAIAFDRAA